MLLNCAVSIIDAESPFSCLAIGERFYRRAGNGIPAAPFFDGLYQKTANTKAQKFFEIGSDIVLDQTEPVIWVCLGDLHAPVLKELLNDERVEVDEQAGVNAWGLAFLLVESALRYHHQSGEGEIATQQVLSFAKHQADWGATICAAQRGDDQSTQLLFEALGDTLIQHPNLVLMIQVGAGLVDLSGLPK